MEKRIPIRAAGSAANPLTEASLPKTGDNRTPNQDEETKQLLSSLPFQSETLPESHAHEVESNCRNLGHLTKNFSIKVP